MAQASGPRGLRHVGSLSASKGNGAVRRFKKEASVILAPGDAVVLTGSAEAVTGIPLITRAQGTEGTPTTITGVMEAREVDRDNLMKKHLAAADSAYVYVNVDPLALYLVQEDGVADTLEVGDVGEACDLIVANANTTLGISQVMLDSSNAGTGDQVQILELAQRVDNALEQYSEWVVIINEHTFKSAGTII